MKFRIAFKNAEQTISENKIMWLTPCFRAEYLKEYLDNDRHCKIWEVIDFLD